MTIQEIRERIDAETLKDREAFNNRPDFTTGNVFHVEVKEGMEVKGWVEENVKIPKGEYYGAGLPNCGSSCDECRGRAEYWAERIGCTSEEIWEAVS